MLKDYWDGIAGEYDRRFRASPLAGLMQEGALRILRDAFSPGMSVLEIGCGTGEEALALAEMGVNVVATDASAGMIAVAKGKADDRRFEGRLEFRALPARNVRSLQPQRFDGMYSLSGALNCIAGFPAFARDIGDLVKPGGLVIASLLNKYCAAEFLNFLLHMDPFHATRRWRNAPLVHCAGEGFKPVEVRYYTRGNFYSWFKGDFDRLQCRALPIIPPRGFLDRVSAKSRLFFRVMKALEGELSDRFPFNHLGDHFILSMRRKGTP